MILIAPVAVLCRQVFFLAGFTVSAVLRLPRAVPRAALLAWIQERAAYCEVLRARVLRCGGECWWLPDLAFEPGRHLRERGVERLAEATHAAALEPLPHDRPLWRVVQLTTGWGGEAAVVLTVHHCIGDGSFLLAVLLAARPAPAPAPSLPSTTSLSAGLRHAGYVTSLGWLAELRCLFLDTSLRAGTQMPRLATSCEIR